MAAEHSAHAVAFLRILTCSPSRDSAKSDGSFSELRHGVTGRTCRSSLGATAWSAAEIEPGVIIRVSDGRGARGDPGRDVVPRPGPDGDVRPGHPGRLAQSAAPDRCRGADPASPVGRTGWREVGASRWQRGPSAMPARPHPGHLDRRPPCRGPRDAGRAVVEATSAPTPAIHRVRLMIRPPWLNPPSRATSNPPSRRRHRLSSALDGRSTERPAISRVRGRPISRLTPPIGPVGLHHTRCPAADDVPAHPAPERRIELR